MNEPTRSPVARNRTSPSSRAFLAIALVAGAVLGGGCSDSGGGSGVMPDYTLTVDPIALTVTPGSDGTAAVTINRTDFSGEVAFTLTGAPGGVSGVFDPVTTTGTTSTLTLSVGGGTTPGDYNMVIRGAASAGNRARTLALTVNEPLPSFEMAIDPSSFTVPQGGNQTTGVNLTRHNFTGDVTFSLLDAPPGVTGTFFPNPSPGVGSVLTLLINAATAPGVYDITVRGTSSVGDDSAVMFLTVTAAP